MKISLYIRNIFFIILLAIIINIEMSFISHMELIKKIDSIHIIESDEFREMGWTRDYMDTDKEYRIKYKYIRKNLFKDIRVNSILTFMYRDNIWERCVLDGVIRIYRIDKEYEDILKKINKECKYYPVPNIQSIKGTCSFDNSWNSVRNYGGNRRHEGTDIMYSENKRNVIPIVSMTSGIVEKKGWLKLGGYRLYIKVNETLHMYYAHLASYADGIQEGQEIYAGQLLGYMGDSGYGKEGTTGKFDVHLHFGIYYKDISLNPYYLLKKFEKKKLCYK